MKTIVVYYSKALNYFVHQLPFMYTIYCYRLEKEVHRSYIRRGRGCWSRTCIVFLNEWIDSFPRWPYSFLVFITLLNDILRINSNFGLQLDKIRSTRNTHTFIHKVIKKTSILSIRERRCLLHNSHTNWICSSYHPVVVLL